MPQIEFDPDSDAELQALVAELEHVLEAAEIEIQTELPRQEAEQAAREAEMKQAAESAPDLRPEAAEQELERAYATWAGAAEHDEHSLAPAIGRTVAGAASALIDRMTSQPPPLPRAEREWHYAVGERSVGPVAQSELIKLLQSGEVAWTALVWNEALSNWVAAQATELAGLAKRAPPPLPRVESPLTPTATESAAGVACSVCGRERQPADRFCAICGTQLK
jgi:hypothetical protein